MNANQDRKKYECILDPVRDEVLKSVMKMKCVNIWNVKTRQQAQRQ